MKNRQRSRIINRFFKFLILYYRRRNHDPFKRRRQKENKPLPNIPGQYNSLLQMSIFFIKIHYILIIITYYYNLAK